jgi:hypothetical protein
MKSLTLWVKKGLDYSSKNNYSIFLPMNNNLLPKKPSLLALLTTLVKHLQPSLFYSYQPTLINPLPNFKIKETLTQQNLHSNRTTPKTDGTYAS